MTASRIVWHRPSGAPRGAAGEPAGTTRGPLHVHAVFGFIANRSEHTTSLKLSREASDAEILLALWERFGATTPERLAGGFAFVLWDERECRLWMGRDRVGAVGLWYRASGERFEAAGQVEPLLASGRPELDRATLVAQVRGSPGPPGRTFYQEITRVEPGTLVEVSRSELWVRRYWRLSARPSSRSASRELAAETLRDLLDRIVGEQTPRGPVAVTVSSGLDSTAVAACLVATRRSPPPLALRWIAPELPEADESQGSQQVCERLGLESLDIEADQHWPLRTGLELDPPLAGPRMNFFQGLWRATFEALKAREVPVLFTGLGGDHLFGGNVFSYPDLLLEGRWWRLVRELVAHLPISELSPWRLARRMILGPILRAYLPLRRFELERPVPWLAERRHDSVPAQGPPLSRRLLPGRRMRLELLADPFLARVLEEQASAAAAFSLELRHPLLDHRLLELAAALPSDESFEAGERKGILRRAMARRLPPEVVWRRDKIYPSAIVRRGLAERETAKVRSLMSNMRVSDLGLVDEGRLRQHYEAYVRGQTRVGTFWHTLTLEAWLRRHFD